MHAENIPMKMSRYIAAISSRVNPHSILSVLAHRALAGFSSHHLFSNFDDIPRIVARVILHRCNMENVKYYNTLPYVTFRK